MLPPLRSADGKGIKPPNDGIDSRCVCVRALRTTGIDKKEKKRILHVVFQQHLTRSHNQTRE
jgi:hypothetical protein